MPRMRLALAPLLLALGCCGGGAATQPGASTAPDSRAGYSVHEWGLVRAGPGDTLVVGAMGPSAPPEATLVVEKPVLYFHVSGGGTIDVASLRVDALGGRVVEHWPHTGAGPDSANVTWTSLRLDPTSCALRAPTLDEPPCRDLPPGDECEAAQLARAATSDSACVRSARGDSPLLFYRSTSTALTVPLVATARGDDLVVRHAGAGAIPGRIVRFRRDGGSVRVVVADPPAPGGSVVIGSEWTDVSAARAAVRETLSAIGLTTSEAEAFLASWDSAFFGEAAVAEEIVERTPAEESLPAEHTILYFLPPADVEQLTTLTFDPPPTAVRRAMAVWSGVAD